jgi:hypothetical protein
LLNLLLLQQLGYFVVFDSAHEMMLEARCHATDAPKNWFGCFLL